MAPAEIEFKGILADRMGGNPTRLLPKNFMSFGNDQTDLMAGLTGLRLTIECDENDRVSSVGFKGEGGVIFRTNPRGDVEEIPAPIKVHLLPGFSAKVMFKGEEIAEVRHTLGDNGLRKILTWASRIRWLRPTR